MAELSPRVTWAQVHKDRHAQMLERDLSEQLRQLFALYGWRVYHTHDSRHSAAGFPDWIALKGPRLVVVELKREGQHPTIEQAAWLEDFKRVPGVEVYVWRPSDLEFAVAILSEKEQPS